MTLKLKDINFNIAMYGTEPVVQSTYSVVYTGDESSVKVNFNVTDETDLTGATAKVHLYFADSSHIEKDAQIDGTVVHYTLKGTENDHAGPVRVDVFITLNGATYTRAGYKFRIDQSLEASAPLVEYAIETLDTVIEGADEWLAQAQTDFGTAQNQRAAEWVSDNDTRDDQFNAAQASRTESFGQSETARTDAFNTSETGRSNTFTTNENARQAAADANETARNNSYTVAENDREERYGIAESNRSATADADHTRAVGDHNTATDDHGIAESDHVTATADHENYAGLLEDGILTTQIVDKLTELETTYAPDLFTVKQQLEHNEQQINTMPIEQIYVPTFEGSNSPYHPSVLYFANGWNGYKFWMAHTPLPINRNPYEPRWECPSIAASNDGVSWVIPTGAPSPLVDLTAEEIAAQAYFSDTSLMISGDGLTLEVWYRKSNDAVGTITDVYRVKTTNGVAFTLPEKVVDSQNTANGLDSITKYTMRTQSVFAKDGKYTALWGTDNGMRRAESVDPATGIWTNYQTVTVVGGSSNNPWHMGVVYDGTDYHMLAYQGVKCVEYYKSSDGLTFNFVKKIIDTNEKKYSNLLGLYQSVPVKVGTEWWLFVSTEIKHPTSANLIRGISLFKGVGIESAVPAMLSLKNFRGEINLQNGSKANSDKTNIALRKNDRGISTHAVGIRQQLDRPTPTYYQPLTVGDDASFANNNIVTAITSTGAATAWGFRYIGEIYFDSNNPHMFYIATADNNWISFNSQALVKTGRLNVGLESTIAITSSIYRVVLNIAGSVLPTQFITGGTDGQDLILLNAYTGGSVTLKHNVAGTGKMVFRSGTDKILTYLQTVRLHNINGTWYEV